MLRNPLILIAVSLLTGCALTQPERETQPITLKVAVNDIYCTDTACSCVHDVAARTYSETLEQLKNEYGIQVQFDYFIDSYQLEDALLSGNYNAALCKPWFAMRINPQAGTDYQRLVDVFDPNGNQGLTGIVIVPADSAIQTLDELNGKTVYLGEDDSYEKHQAAFRLFAQHGIVPAQINTRSSCGENIGMLQDGKADAAVISDYALSADCAVDFAKPEDFRILAHTETIPLTSLLLDRNQFDDRSVRKIKKALLAVSGENAPATLLGKGFTDPEPWTPPELEPQP